MLRRRAVSTAVAGWDVAPRRSNCLRPLNSVGNRGARRTYATTPAAGRRDPDFAFVFEYAFRTSCVPPTNPDLQY